MLVATVFSDVGWQAGRVVGGSHERAWQKTDIGVGALIGADVGELEIDVACVGIGGNKISQVLRDS